MFVCMYVCMYTPPINANAVFTNRVLLTLEYPFRSQTTIPNNEESLLYINASQLEISNKLYSQRDTIIGATCGTETLKNT